MSPQNIAILREICENFAKYRALDVDGEGNNLHDIKYSFDYVREYINEQQLSDTIFGQDLTQKVESAGNVISELWNCLDNLEKAIEYYCSTQEEVNNTI